MKTLLLLAAFTLAAASAVSAQDVPQSIDVSKVSFSNVSDGKLLKQIKTVYPGEGSFFTNFTYAPNGQLLRVESPDSDGGLDAYSFVYEGGTIDGFQYNMYIACEESPSWFAVIYLRLNSDLFIEKAYEKAVEYHNNYEEPYNHTYTFTYEGKRLVKMIRTEGNETSVLEYNNGNITKVTASEVEGTQTYTYISEVDYSTVVPNRAGLMLFDEMFDIDMDELAVAYFAGLLGRPTALLPSKITEVGDQEYETLSWTVDADGYPSMLNIKGFYGNSAYSYDDIFYFTWEDRASLTSIEAVKADAAAEVYTLGGVKVSGLDRLPAGVYIVKSGAEARKLLVK